MLRGVKEPTLCSLRSKNPRNSVRADSRDGVALVIYRPELGPDMSFDVIAIARLGFVGAVKCGEQGWVLKSIGVRVAQEAAAA